MENENKQNRLKRGFLLGLGLLLLVIMALVISVYAIFKFGFYDKANYVENTGYELVGDIPQETYVDSEGNVQVEEEATLEEDRETELLTHQEEVMQKLKSELDNDTGTYNLLLIGVDRRSKSENGRSDVMILVTVNDDRKTIYLTSFLRDLYSNIPGKGVRKLNAAYAYGGAELCIETITDTYGVEIDNYAKVDFDDVIYIVDLLGGVDLELTEDEVKVANKYIKGMCDLYGENYAEHELTGSGMLHLDGYQAVGYARNRYSGNKNDFGRTQRQRNVLTALFDKVGNADVMELPSIVQSVLPYVTHDAEQGRVLELLVMLPRWIEYDIEEQHVPYDNMYHSENYILIPNDMEETIQKIRGTIY